MELTYKKIDESKLSFFDLPLEVRDQVYEDVAELEVDVVADVTTAPPRKGRRAFRLQRMFPAGVRLSKGLFNASRQLQDGASNCLSQKLIFYNKHSAEFIDMPRVLGEDVTKLIQKFELRAEFLMKNKHQYTWPAILRCFVEELPNLEWFKLPSEWVKGSVVYPQNESGDSYGTISRVEQERRAKYSFGAWLSLRHPNLDLMRACAEAETNWDSLEVELTHYVVLEKNRDIKFIGKATEIAEFGTEDKEEEKAKTEGPKYPLDRDQFLNTKLIRRMKHNEWSNFDPKSVAIKLKQGQTLNDITTSEVPTEDDEYFIMLDQRGYQLWEMFEAKGWVRLDNRTGRKVGLVKADGLIDHGRKLKVQAAEKKTRQDNNAASGSGSRGGRGSGRGGRDGRGGRGRGRGQG